MQTAPSLMLQETEQSPSVVAKLLAAEAATFAEIGRLFENSPWVITTAARGSSDHAATFFKYLMEIATGIPVASIGPSVASVYGAKLKLEGGLHFTVSQSGASPDIIAVQEAAKRGGATTVAVVNVTDSPLAKSADIVLALHAGEEKSVAATKSFIASVAALSGVVAAASEDKGLQVGLGRLPEALAATKPEGRETVEDLLFNARSLFTGGRGTAYAISLEAALKAKETANIHAEAFSLAELMHGPMRLVEDGFPIISFIPRDEALKTSIEALNRLGSFGANLVSFGNAEVPGYRIPSASTGNGHLDPLVSLINYYRIIEAVTRRKGFDPDKPRNLAKVTSTV
ncbi:SIS domain protein [Ochrobactrum quorumnocens]|uniref:SIS domain protein n=1 Tax=Ochrobactrum quorumnocens TaxID=271865 RepID=A0A248UHA4_9HYPH|nr:MULTISPECIES: SIS domain-containing protein [Brucella/Ochrobactrum group]ASV86105.1 SIS domain protein [[Ochrobactrum] quorumnocens]KAA9368119.1 SIS domain-containing protein [[Ochrobactrum] quorumnocens]MBD7992008.1 SIS domain-containing protein [Ochrobactrum gallinarum]MDH7789284.1 glucosamine--fructose-6-phosphate aminotransferase (isomerizing) [Ochrobactrum sp. AN78]